MRRETQNVLLVLLGGALCKLVLTGAHTRYVKPAMGPWLLAAGGFLVLLAAVAIVRDVRVARRDTSATAPDAHGDDHQHAGRSPWLLVLPVLAVFLIAPPALGADSVRRAEPRQPERPVQVNSFPPLPPGAEVPMSLSEFVTRSAYDGTNALRSRTVRLTGFLVKEGRDSYLARMAITCCAADAMPLKVRLRSGDEIDFRTDDWVSVTGTARPGSGAERAGFVPDLRVATIRGIREPADPYEH